MGANIKHFNDKYSIDERNVYSTCKCIFETNEDVIRVCIMHLMHVLGLSLHPE